MAQEFGDDDRAKNWLKRYKPQIDARGLAAYEAEQKAAMGADGQQEAA